MSCVPSSRGCITNCSDCLFLLEYETGGFWSFRGGEWEILKKGPEKVITITVSVDSEYLFAVVEGGELASYDIGNNSWIGEMLVLPNICSFSRNHPPQLHSLSIDQITFCMGHGSAVTLHLDKLWPRESHDQFFDVGFSSNLFRKQLVLFGGIQHNTKTESNLISSFSGRSWNKQFCGGSLPEPRREHSADVIGDLLVVVGGRSGCLLLQNAFTLNLLTLTWRSLVLTHPFDSPRSGHFLGFVSVPSRRCKSRTPASHLLMIDFAKGDPEILLKPFKSSKSIKKKQKKIIPRKPQVRIPVKTPTVWKVATSRVGTGRVFSNPGQREYSQSTVLPQSDVYSISSRLSTKRQGNCSRTETAYKQLFESGSWPRVEADEEHATLDRLYYQHPELKKLQRSVLRMKWIPQEQPKIIGEEQLTGLISKLNPAFHPRVPPKPRKWSSVDEGFRESFYNRLYKSDVENRAKAKKNLENEIYYGGSHVGRVRPATAPQRIIPMTFIEKEEPTTTRESFYDGLSHPS